MSRLTRIKEVPKKKDIWDKISILSSVSSTLLIGLFGAVFSYLIQQKQQSMAELEAITKLLPSITSHDENTQMTAMVLLNELTNTKLVARIAEINITSGKEKAIAIIAKEEQTSDQNKLIAEQVLDNIREQKIPKNIKTELVNSSDLPVRELSIEYSFENPKGDVAGYKVYMGTKEDKIDNLICNAIGNTSPITCAAQIDSGVYYFQLTAYDSTGIESPRSPPFKFEFQN